MKFHLAAGSLLLCAIIAACASHETTPEKPVHALAEGEYFVSYVKPILETHCLRCHQGRHPPAGLSLVQRSGLFAPRRNGRAYVVPGDPRASLLLTSISPGGSHPRTIPPLEFSLTESQLGALWEWIEDGAFWPDVPAGHLRPQLHSLPAF
ncbi:MAG TPA: c-type cytochrome domain-containing protein [Prosthecobacter sp.]|nr:c-type cytochrome domain-containing protein [Prosthecobacter sp.]